MSLSEHTNKHNTDTKKDDPPLDLEVIHTKEYGKAMNSWRAHIKYLCGVAGNTTEEIRYNVSNKHRRTPVNTRYTDRFKPSHRSVPLAEKKN